MTRLEDLARTKRLRDQSPPKQKKEWPQVAKAMDDPKAKKFLVDLAELQRKHGLFLSHEDDHGGFEIVDTDGDDLIRWQQSAWLLLGEV